MTRSDYMKWAVIAGVIAAIVMARREPVTPPPASDIAADWVVVVEQTEARDVATAKIMASGWWQGLQSKGVRWATYDYDNPQAASYRAKADDVGLPALFFLTEQGKIVQVMKMPKTVAAMPKVTGRATL